MKTKVFKLTDDMFRTYQAIANVDAVGKVYVHYLNAFDSNIDGIDIDIKTIKLLCSMVEKWATKQGFIMWSY
jgi:hypothetical protein